MPRTRPPWYEAAYAVLADGEWHDIEEVKRPIGPTIPIHVALRHYEMTRRSKRRQYEARWWREYSSEPPPPSAPPPMEVRTRMGRQQKANVVVQNSVRDGVWIRDGAKIRLAGLETQPYRRGAEPNGRPRTDGDRFLADGEWHPVEELLAVMQRRSAASTVRKALGRAVERGVWERRDGEVRLAP